MSIKLLKTLRMLSTNMYMQLSIEARGPKISLSLQLRPYFVCVSREAFKALARISSSEPLLIAYMR